MSSRAKTLLMNIGWSFLGQITATLIGIFLLPRLIHLLGMETYALYSLIGILGGYIPILTFGAGVAMLKYLPECRAVKDMPRLRELIDFTLLLHVGGGLLAASLIWLARDWLLNALFHIPDPLKPYLPIVTLSIIATGLWMCMFQWVTYTLQGLHLFLWSNLLSTVKTLLPLAGSVLILSRGGSLIHVAFWIPACYILLTLISSVHVTRVLLRELKGSATATTPSAGSWKEFSSYSLKMFVNQLGWIGSFQLDKLLIGAYLPLQQLTFYLVPFSLAQTLHMLFASTTAALFPMFSELQSLGRDLDVRKMYLKGSRLVLWLALPVFLTAFLLGYQGLALWLGNSFAPQSHWVLRWLLGAQFLYTILYVALTYCNAIGKPQYCSALLLANAGVSCILWIWLIPIHGIVGAAFAGFSAQLLTAPLFLWFINSRLLNISAKTYLQECFWKPACSGICTLFVIMPLRAYAGTWGGLFLAFCGGLAIYTALFPWVWPKEDRDFLKQLLPHAWR